MEDFSLKTYFIPELLKNKIDFRILGYENGDKGKPSSLMVVYEYSGFWNAICRVDTKSVTGSPYCYNVVWYSETPSFGRFNTGYGRSVDLVHDIRKVIDFNFKGENKMNNKIYRVSNINYESNPWQMDEVTVTVNVLGSHCALREDCDRIKEAIESISDTNKSNYRGGFTTWRNEYQKERDKFDIKDVIFNNPATIVFWADGTKTVVKAENEEFDPEKGLAMAIAKKALGNNYNYYDVFKKYVGRYEKKQKKG